MAGLDISLNNIGIIYQRQGIYAKAVEYLKRSIKLEDEMGNTNGVGSCLINLGYIYNEHGDTTMGMLYFNKGLKINTHAYCIPAALGQNASAAKDLTVVTCGSSI